MAEKRENLISRAPVVVVLGHVDSGKTSILDNIRKAHVAEKEIGGITQHVGAYEVEFEGKKITFIDTPGHEAFSAMRSRGAKVADIAILVIDGCKGIEAQTKEAVLHIKKAGIPMIIAINKIDRPETNPGKIKRELSGLSILVEESGGKIPLIEVSAKTGKRISDLLEIILLVAEMEGLKGDISKPAEGVVIESYLDSHRGPTATLLLRDGVLKVGDIIGTSSTFGKIKILENFQGRLIDNALPSMPVIVLGFEEVPGVGEKFKVFSDIEEAKKSIEKREPIPPKVLFFEPGKKVLNLILKTDVLGSIEAIEEVIKTLPQEKVELRIVKAEAGEINESDIKLAKSAKAKVLGFRVKINKISQDLAEREKVKIMKFDLIYNLVERLLAEIERILEPEVVRIDLGKVKTLIIFWAEKNRQIVGGRIIEGEVKKGTKIEILRSGEIVGRGKIINLQRNKKDIEKATKREEIGILYEGEKKIEEGDILIIFTEEKRK